MKLVPVVIEWMDTCRHGDSWEETPVSVASTELCISYGIIMAENDEAVAISPHLGIEKGICDQVQGTLTIPRSAIVKIRRLNLGRQLYGKDKC